jgi:hypothetical protein
MGVVALGVALWPGLLRAQDSGPWGGGDNPAAQQHDAVFPHYTFRDGETLDEVRIHYATMGEPHRNGSGEIDNAVLVLHWTGSDSRAVLTPLYTKALYDPDRPLDARRYFLIFPDSIGLGAPASRATVCEASSRAMAIGTWWTCSTSSSPRLWRSSISTPSLACRWEA